METRKPKPKNCILPETPGLRHLEIVGCRLPSYKQVLYCYIANMEKLRSKDKVSKVERDAANAVVNESLKHYVKAMIPHINEKMA